MKRDYRRLACLAARAAADKKAIDIKILDLRAESDIADYLVIAGGESSPQMRAIQTGVVEALEAQGLLPLRRDGQDASRWIALDYGGLVVHILLPSAREFYRLEQMWETPKAVAWRKSARRKRPKSK